MDATVAGSWGIELSTDDESGYLWSEATQGVWGIRPPMHEMP